MFNKMGVPTQAIVENMAYFDGDDGKRFQTLPSELIQILTFT